MQMTLESFFTKSLPKIPWKSAAAVIQLAEDGATIPFMARYRKEKTGGLDEVSIKEILDKKQEYEETLKRQAFILKEIEAQGNLTGELKKRILNSFDLNLLEEIYRPFKKKRKTKATLAREAGLEPFADWIFAIGQGENSDDISLEVKAKEYQNVKAGFVTYEQILKGAQDILVDRLTNIAELRERAKQDLWRSGKLVSKKTKSFKPKSKYTMYADYSEDIKNLMQAKSSHRYLAVRRGWQESELSIAFVGNEEEIIRLYEKQVLKEENCRAAAFLKTCARQAYSVYVHPSISNEIHRSLKESADNHAIEVFAQNVKKLLLASPFGAKTILAVDPGLRTGCKIALVDKSGTLISHTVVHTQGDKAKAKAKEILSEITSKISLSAIAVGNGTAGRETEKFFRETVEELKLDVPVVLVNESGASIYSASEIAREEFPDLDITVRGAVSIGRRLQDPLAELVKIDPKSIGVGQYQHDVSQTKLKKNLGFVVESCVNQVGVDLNTASISLLSYVSGIGPALAKNIIDYRTEKGLFEDRDALLKVPRFSTKAFEQAAGFLRIPNSKNPLDNTGIHPESYAAVRDMAKDLNVNISTIIGENAKKLLELRTKWLEIVGEYTFDDIIKELESPGRDPRGTFEPVSFRDDIHEIGDLKENMICPGVVTNVTNFGAFVDIGVHQDGLVHISALSHKFVEDPKSLLSPGDQVKVKVLSVDVEKKQISLTMLLEDKPASKVKASKKKGKPKKKQQKNQGKPRKPRQVALNNPFAGLADQLKNIK
tara:strand:- start:7599 stop:9914 length:2316 start_codon:yes stop_codon:yes gene_type:complete